MLIIIIFAYLWWWFTPVGDFYYDKSHPHINKKILFLKPMIKIKNVEGYTRSDFSDKYSNYIFSINEFDNPKHLSDEIEEVKNNELFIIKGFFKFTRRGTGFNSDTNSTYYIVEDNNKDIFVLQKLRSISQNKPYYKKYSYQIIE